jgi:triacylglycerol esterase/lipase EstA (alpha/beta hydrolase family)
VPAQARIVPAIEDWSCRGETVILVHGTFANAQTWAPFAPLLRDAGYCVFAPNYGDGGFGLLGVYATGPVKQSARFLDNYVDRVLAATGDDKVSMVGHSQGGMMPRYYLRYLGGAAKVSELIGLAPSNHGTTQPLTPVVAPICEACADQMAGSPFLQELNAGERDVEPGVDYTVISTIYDAIVLPYPSQFLGGPSTQVTNVTLQEACPLNLAEHATVIADPVTWQWVLHALNHNGPADPAFQPACLPSPL